jgi:hypothetical protein
MEIRRGWMDIFEATVIAKTKTATTTVVVAATATMIGKDGEKCHISVRKEGKLKGRKEGRKERKGKKGR